jgi:hypothetical protein
LTSDVTMLCVSNIDYEEAVANVYTYYSFVGKQEVKVTPWKARVKPNVLVNVMS